MPAQQTTGDDRALRRLLRLATVPLGRIGPRMRRTATLLAHSARARRSVALRVVAAITVAVVVGGAHRARSQAETLRARWGPSVTVLVAARDLPEGSELDDSEVHRREIPATAAPLDHVSSLDHPVALAEPIREGEFLTRAHLSDEHDSRAPPGTVAVVISPALPPPTLEPGDRVDVVGVPGVGDRAASPTTAPSGSAAISADPIAVIAHGATVLHPPGEDHTIEVAVSPGDAEAITAAALTGAIAVLRRSP